ncbi:MAG: hypothetical protein PSV16_15185 [Flavobacterium sp.]|nr:hypothetical protein [Flavobacterium sp.]
MNNLISFFRKKYPEFVPLALTEIPEHIISLKIEGKQHEFTFFNMLYEPQLIGVVIPNKWNNYGFEDVTKMTISNEKKIQQIHFDVIFERTILADEVKIAVFSVQEAKLKNGMLKKWYVNRFYNRAIAKNNFIIKTFDAKVYQKLIAFFYYPKPVFIVSTQANLGKNAFPVDTCKQIGNHFIFGVRRSNAIISTINPGDVIAIGLSDFSKRDLIYQLGKYIPEQNLIQFTRNEKYNIAVPEIVVENHFVSITEIIRYDNQNVYVGKIIASEAILKSTLFFAHIHKFWLLSSERTKLYYG